jgi:hypothetical protein
MNFEIRETPFEKRLYGRSKSILENQTPRTVMFAAMDETWGIVRGRAVPNAGLNHIIYTNARQVFAGLEISVTVDPSWGLERVDLVIPRYLYYRHVGPYDLLAGVYRRIDAEIDVKGLTRTGQSLEIYGHWNDNPSELVTEILIGLKSPQ